MKRLELVLFALVAFAISVSFSCRSAPTLSFPKSRAALNFQESNNGVQYTLSKDFKILQTFTLDESFQQVNLDQVSNGVRLTGSKGEQLGIVIVEDASDFVLYRLTRNMAADDVAQDCMDLNIGRANWYGGPENHDQYWPLEKFKFEEYSYVTKEKDNCAITERYWLSSSGLFIYVEDETPLFVNQNAPGRENQLCLKAKRALPYDTYNVNFTFNYYVGWAPNARAAHLQAVQRFLKKPTGVADERMVRHPIWSTWAIYKTEINETIVQSFADDILSNKFENSQLEIDDDWEDCYGALTFRKSKFPNIADFTKSLKAQGFRVTLWIHPFINKDCTEWYDLAKEKGYLVLDHQGNPDTQWWNSKTGEAAYIDFTNPEAATWYSDRLKRLQTEDGIDSFKFDAGESSWAPPDPVLTGNQKRSPSLITSAYIRTVAQFGPIVEVRSGQGTQDLPIFLRMIDKDSEWNWNNGLQTLVTTLLQLNLAGYPFVLPDMIGGNGYNNHPPNKELFIRWLQANVFMPSLQFSYVPWQYDQETIEISLAMTKLHAQYTDLIMKRFRLASENGDPVNPPLWWADPLDVVAQGNYDQFMLGDEVIAAPILIEGQVQRDIYLPTGNWQDGNTKDVHKGPKWLMSYPAPISVLPYFVRVTT